MRSGRRIKAAEEAVAAARSKESEQAAVKDADVEFQSKLNKDAFMNSATSMAERLSVRASPLNPWREEERFEGQLQAVRMPASLPPTDLRSLHPSALPPSYPAATQTLPRASRRRMSKVLLFAEGCMGGPSGRKGPEPKGQ